MATIRELKLLIALAVTMCHGRSEMVRETIEQVAVEHGFSPDEIQAALRQYKNLLLTLGV